MKLPSIVAPLLAALIVACGGETDPTGNVGSGGTPSTTSTGGGNVGGSHEGGGSDGGGGGVIGANPHPLYPPLDLDTLPGDGGAESGPYTPPTLPTTTRVVDVTSTGNQAGTDLTTACDTAGTAVDVPSAAGNIGVINIGNTDDCDITLGSNVVIDFLVIGSLPGPTHAPSHRVRIRGGQIGSVFVVGASTDIVLDGVTINNGVVPSGQRAGTAIYLPTSNADEVVDRFAVVNSFIRLVAVTSGSDLDGCAYLGARARNVFFANNNIVTAGNRNSWGFRIGGGDNAILIDNTVRVSFHKLVRMNDAPVDYVYIKGGTWMREETLTSGGALNNDSFAQLSGSTTHNVFVHDPTVYLLADTPASFGATADPVQNGLSWEARNITWHAPSANAISEQRLQEHEGYCTGVGGQCDYGTNTHTFTYDPNLTFPAAPWRDLPTFEDDDPDSLPVLD